MANMESAVEGALRFPDMRLNLIVYTDVLASVEHQQRFWVRHEPRPSFDSFIDIVHFFFDDTGLAEDPYACIGEILRNRAEGEAVGVLVSALSAVLREVGHRKSDKAYTQAPSWPSVIEFARQLADLMTK